MASSDQRQHDRVVCGCKVYLGGQSNEELDVADLSETGMRLLSPVTLGVGKTVKVTFAAQNTTVEGTIRNERPAQPWGLHIGIEFATAQPWLLKAVAG
jgi:sorbitol-specific phosphotransferase system component IIBC